MRLKNSKPNRVYYQIDPLYIPTHNNNVILNNDFSFNFGKKKKKTRGITIGKRKPILI